MLRGLLQAYFVNSIVPGLEPWAATAFDRDQVLPFYTLSHVPGRMASARRTGALSSARIEFRDCARRARLFADSVALKADDVAKLVPARRALRQNGCWYRHVASLTSFLLLPLFFPGAIVADISVRSSFLTPGCSGKR